jgi:tetratricopeptide (TPR) repeat protein
LISLQGLRFDRPHSDFLQGPFGGCAVVDAQRPTKSPKRFSASPGLQKPRSISVLILCCVAGRAIEATQASHPDSISISGGKLAIVLLREGIKLDAARAEFHAALGESYFTVGKVDAAVEEFKLLLQLDHSARSYTYMGLCQRHLGKLDAAKDYLNLGLKLDPRDSVILFNLGVIAKKQQEQVQAEQYLRQALKINPNYKEALFE